MAKLGPAGAVEAPAGVEQHRRRQQELDSHPGAFGHERDHRVAEAGNALAHGDDEQRNGEGGGEDEVAAERREFAVLAVPVLGLCLVFRRRRVAGRDHRLGQPNWRQHFRRVADDGLFGRQVDAGIDHARKLLERLFDPGDAGGAAHAADGERGLGHLRVIAGTLDGADQRGRIDLGRIGDHMRFLGGEIDAHFGDAGQLLQRPLDPPHAARAGHAFDLDVQVFIHFVCLLGLSGGIATVSGISGLPSAR